LFKSRQQRASLLTTEAVGGNNSSWEITVTQLVVKFFVCGNQSVISMHTKARHWTPILSMLNPVPTSTHCLKSILISFLSLCLSQ
jgi:hypothetical protein